MLFRSDWSNALKHINIVRQRAAYANGEQKPPQVSLIDGGIRNTESTANNMIVTQADIVNPKLPTGGSYDLFVDWMLEERARELYGELNRWEDLVRTGTLVERAKKYNPDSKNSIKEHHILRPIPNTFIDRLLPKPEIATVQNPGYY